MSKIYKERHEKLGSMVLILFPKVMQMILKDYITPKGLQKRFLKNNFHLVFTEKEVVLMEKLPNMDDFTIEISYKILRFEFDMLDEPKCKWGNVPHDTEVEIADDIQRLINATNSIIKIKPEEVTASYSEKFLEEIKLMVTRIDSYLEQDDLSTLFNSLCRSETDSSSILQDLTRIKAIKESLPDTDSEKRERYSRVSMAIIETFPNILRDVIESIISASHLYQKCIPFLKSFYAEQQKNLATLQHSNSYDSLDITLIYKLLRQFPLLPSPTKGWGNIPDKVDIQVEDDIERIRYYRNQLAHRSDIKINKSVFDEYFQTFRDIGHRMDLYFNQKSNYEQRIIGYKTCRMDAEMLAKYENAMKEMENIKLKYEKKPIKVYWGDSFDICLMNLRSLLKEEKIEGRTKVRVQIIFQNENDIESNIEVLNSLKEEINEGLSGIELIVVTKGSIVLHVDILVGMLETNEKLHTTLVVFLEKILERNDAFTTDSIDILLFHEEDSVFLTIHIQQNGYKGIVVSISDKVSEDQLLLSTIQTRLTEASHKMYIATKYHVYLKEITIIIPSTWSNNGAYSYISSSIAKNPHVKIGEYPDYKSPFARTYGKCGKGGLYIHFTTDLVKAGDSGGYGNLGIVFTHEWGHYRWGIFDEYPTVREKGQLVKFYQYDGKYEPVRCVTSMEGDIYDSKHGGKCSVDENGKPDHNCLFSPHSDHRATAKASIMGHAYVKTMSLFCDGESSDPTTYHNRFAPNNQNSRCKGRSAWEVMRQHSDFKNTVPGSATANTVPTFRILQVTQQHKICLVVDVSGSMGSKIRQTRDSMASLIKYGLPNNSYVGIVKFSSTATLLKGLTLISTDGDRSTLVSYLPTTTGGSTSIGAGLQTAYQALSSNGNVNGSIIYLATDGQENRAPYIADVQPTLLSNGITVHSLAISNAADPKIQDLAFASGGKSYFYSASTANSTALLDALTEPFKDLSSDALIRIKSVHVDTKDQNGVFEEKFYIDGTVGRETVVQLIAENLRDVNLTVSHEDDVYTIIGASSDVGGIAVKIPGIAGIGEYMIWITSSINRVVGTISIQSRARTINADVIQTDVMTEISNFNFTSNLPFPLYVSVLRGANPVIRATVIANIENQNGQSSSLLLKDNAVGADVEAGDGIYSGYILPNLITANGRHSIKVIIAGYNAAVVISKPVSTALSEAYGEVQLQEESIGQFMRVNLANEVVVSNYVQSDSDIDVIPPSPILTLHLRKVDTDNNTFTLGWTSVGDDFDTGTAIAYDFRISADYTKITTFPDQQEVLLSEQIPNEAGNEESFSFKLNKEGTHSTYFVIVRAIDDFNNTGDISNVVSVSVITDPSWLKDKLSIWSSGFRSTFLIGISAGVALILIVVLVSCVTYVSKRRGGRSSKGSV